MAALAVTDFLIHGLAVQDILLVVAVVVTKVAQRELAA